MGNINVTQIKISSGGKEITLRTLDKKNKKTQKYFSDEKLIIVDKNFTFVQSNENGTQILCYKKTHHSMVSLGNTLAIDKLEYEIFNKKIYFEKIGEDIYFKSLEINNY